MNTPEVSDTNRGINSPLLQKILLREAAWHVQESGGDLAAAIERELLEFQLSLVERQTDRLEFEATYLRNRLSSPVDPVIKSEGEDQPF